jgi:hypothetical protein
VSKYNHRWRRIATKKNGSGGLVSVKGSPVVGKKWYTFCMLNVLIEMVEDTKRVIRSCKSKKDRQHNGQKWC